MKLEIKTCLDCEHYDKKRKTKVHKDYIYCKRLRYWLNYKDKCGLIRQS